MSVSDCQINCPSEEELRHILFDPPDPPELPAMRLPYHNGRRWKLETQGRANRRVRRNYRAQMDDYYNPKPSYAALAFELVVFPTNSLYDFITSRRA